jgi:tRNA threonylcarbamoyladenosine biosynthesis protein TsaE
MILLHTKSADETANIGEKIGSVLEKGDVIALSGSLAAGKTTLAKGIAKGIGVEEEVTSPTFTLISEYRGRVPLYHMDMYRLDGQLDFENLGAEEMLYGDGVCLIEWSEKIEALLPGRSIRIRLESDGDSGRRISIQGESVERIFA